jgi:hypothetical protein
MLLDRAFDPDDVLEQHLVLVRRRQPSELQTWPVYQHTSQDTNL